MNYDAGSIRRHLFGMDEVRRNALLVGLQFALAAVQATQQQRIDAVSLKEHADIEDFTRRLEDAVSEILDLLGIPPDHQIFRGMNMGEYAVALLKWAKAPVKAGIRIG